MCYLRIFLFLLSLVWTSPLFAYESDNFRCDKATITCVVADKNLTVGDYAAFFDRSGNVVAVGQVIAVNKNGHREVEITETFNRITRSAQLRLITHEDYQHLRERFQVPRRMFPKALGLAVAAARLRVLSGFNGQEYNIFFSGRLSNDLSIVLRSVYAKVSGVANKGVWVAPNDRDTNYVSIPEPTTIQGLGLTSGIAYEALTNNLVSFRGEFGLGIMSVNAEVGENVSLQEVKLDQRIRNGANMLVRLSGSALLNVTPDWHLELMLTENYIFRSHLTSLGLGVIKDL